MSVDINFAPRKRNFALFDRTEFRVTHAEMKECSVNYLKRGNIRYTLRSVMEKGKLKRKAIDLSVKLIYLYDRIEKKAFLKNQLARSGSSIGANVHEAEYAESLDDFVHKLKIALKECNETEYWLQVLSASCPDFRSEAQELRGEAGIIRRMLISSIQTCQNKQAEKHTRNSH